VSVSWFYESPSSGTDPELARGIARKLCRDSLVWARTLVVGLRPSQTRRQLEEELFAEVIAYGLCLLELRLSGAAPAGHGALGDLVRHECGVLVERASWRRRTRCKRLPDLAAAPGGSRYAQIYPAGKAGGRGQARLTKEMFEQFRQCTGLGSEVLVGKGENLASLARRFWSCSGPRENAELIFTVRFPGGWGPNREPRHQPPPYSNAARPSPAPVCGHPEFQPNPVPPVLPGHLTFLAIDKAT